MLSKNIYLLGCLSVCLNGYTYAKAPAEATTQQQKQQQDDDKNEYIKTLEDAANNVEEVYKKLNNGSASALNQIAAAFYTLGEQYEKHVDTKEKKLSKQFYEKAALYFEKADQANCKEAAYNAGLTYSKLKQYDQASVFYRKCIQKIEENMQKELNSKEKEKNVDLALKAAGNLAVLMMNKNIDNNIKEIKTLLVLGKKYKEKKQGAVLLETAMVILTDLNTNTEDKNRNENDQDKQAKTIELA